LGAFINQAADTFDGNGDSFRKALRELSQTAGRLGDSRTDLFGTVKNLQILVDALSRSNEQIVQFSGHLASVSQVLADSSQDLDKTLGTLNQALSDVRGFLDENNETLIASINKVTDFTSLLSNQSDDIEQILHVLPNAIANFYNIYNPAQGTANGLLGLPEFTNPVQFICANFDAAGTTDNYKRTEICRQRMAPVLRRLMMNYPPIMSHGINTITAYKGQVIYDTPATEAKAQTYIPYLEWIPAEGRYPPRSGEGGDVSSLFLPPNPVAGPPPPAQPYTLGPVILPPGPEPGGPPPAAPGPLPAEAAPLPAEAVPPMQPVAPGGGG
jgi:phospholipid/cholesterol/gamma-HCH transport system substrate-binding protein